MIAFCTRSLKYRTNIYRKLSNDLRAFPMSENQKIKAVLIDVSGTLHVESTAIPGAVEALKRLRSSDVAIRFVTNTTKESKRSLVDKLISLGFDIQSDEVFTSLTAARNLIEAKGVRPLLILEESALEDFKGIEVNDPNSVVVGLAPSKFNYQSLQDAFRLILNGASLIAIHKARYYKRSDGLTLGPGPFVVGLEYATGVQAEVAGKPEKTFFLESLRGLNCSPQSAVMIGDDVKDDINGAQNIGMKGILVRTGKYRDQDENKITPGPNVVCDDFPGAVDHIFKNWL